MIGTKLGSYEILEKLGQGGMGEVWKGRDTTLDREVAIKVLPEFLASDRERLARFEREAKLLASLNHPGIAAVHGLHEQEGRRFLVMELVPGRDLSRRLAEGPLEVEQALFVGVQVAEALEAAHAQGVIHRDLKPANIILMPDGRAKVLDFGLAKVAETASGSASVSPTVTTGGTADGVILGTAAYMSPEQARGRSLDRRTDVWSFGCVLFECLTARSIFKGETISDSLGAILHKEPDWSLLPAGTPPTVRLLLRRCLSKDPGKRLHDIADARIELEGAIEDPDSSSAGLAVSALTTEGARRRGAPWALLGAAVLALGLGLAAGWLARGAPPELPLRKLDLGVRLAPGEVSAALSPDGRQIAFLSGGKLWVQALDALEPRELEGTDGASNPFWSPDGDSIGYFLGRRLWKIPAVGGTAIAIGDLGGGIAGGNGASWGEDNRIVVSRGNSGLLAISALGGEVSELVPLGEDDSDFHDPNVLPGGRGILFVVHGKDQGPGALAVIDGEERRVLLDLHSGFIDEPVYAPSGHILFRRWSGEATQGLWALPFSLSALEKTGEPFLVVPEARYASVSRDGTLLAYVHRPPTANQGLLAWSDRTGKILEPVGGERRNPGNLSLSPDGRRLAFTAQDPEGEGSDLWVRDLERETELRLTVDERFEFNPLWTPTGDAILYGSFGGDLTVHLVPADGSGPARDIAKGIAAADLTPDGTGFVAMVPREGKQLGFTGDSNLTLLALDGSGEPRMLIDSPDRETGGRISPDGRWLVYQALRGDVSQVYLTRFPEATGRWQVSVTEGEGAVWAPDGRRLYFREGMKLMEVTVAPGDEPRLGKPTLLFELQDGSFAVPAGGERLLIVDRQGDREESDPPGIKIVQNWFREFHP